MPGDLSPDDQVGVTPCTGIKTEEGHKESPLEGPGLQGYGLLQRSSGIPGPWPQVVSLGWGGERVS